MTINNKCSSLIVYGSYVPGGEKHALVADLPGVWEKGFIKATLLEAPDDIGPGGQHELEAWCIHFADCNAETFTPEYDAQVRVLYNRWQVLDEKMGSAMVRGQARWWPEGVEPVVGKNGMVVVNIYLPVKNFSWLQNRDVEPSPDDEGDVVLLWQHVKQGVKYDWCHFIALLKAIEPESYPALFGDLPGGDKFINKLHSLYRDQQTERGDLLSVDEERYRLYVVPEKDPATPQAEILALVQQDLQVRADFLAAHGQPEDAEQLRRLRFEFATPPEGYEENDLSADAFVSATEGIGDYCKVTQRWQYCLQEACYGLAADFSVQQWLMSHWYDIEFDFEPAFQLWRRGYDYEIKRGVCYIF